MDIDSELFRHLDRIFEFKLAEVVYLRMAIDCVYGINKPTPHVITERRLQQCPGGLQKSYVIGAIVFQECELTRDMPAMRPATGDELDAMRSINAGGQNISIKRMDVTDATRTK